MWGSPLHLAAMAETIRDAASRRVPLIDTDGIELRVLVAETNAEEFTYDGIDNGGERVAKEVYQEVEKIGEEGLKVTRLSISGYSMGGLIGRYLVGILLQRKFFDDVTPVNFNTFATPHIGLPRYPNIVSAISSSIGPRFLSRTGEQFFVSDKWSSTGRPLLEVMADPQHIFYRALSMFPNITIYANAIHDYSSPYLTAAIEMEDPFLHHDTNGIEITYHDEYPNLIKSYCLPAQPPPPPPKPAVLSVSWFKSFNGSNRPMLPPALQFKYPYKIIVFIALPLLLPTFIGLVLIRFSLASRSSRKRIMSLEKDESYAKRLVHAIEEVEYEMEGTVVDLVNAEDATAGASLQMLTMQQEHASSGSAPVLTEVQKTMVRSLNRLPNLKKERTFYDHVRNSHATIICRDPAKFKFHEKGREGPLKHWTNHFVF